MTSPQPVPAVSVLTVSPVTTFFAAPEKVAVCTGPGLPDEYTHWYLMVPDSEEEMVAL